MKIRERNQLPSLGHSHSFLPHDDTKVPSRTALQQPHTGAISLDQDRPEQMWEMFHIMTEARCQMVVCGMGLSHAAWLIKSCKNVACYEPILSLRDFTATPPLKPEPPEILQVKGILKNHARERNGNTTVRRMFLWHTMRPQSKIITLFFPLTILEGFYTSPCISVWNY